MTDKQKVAEEKFLEGFNCAQAVFSAFKDELELTEEEVLKISCGFGAGMGRMQNTCGAVTGAFMVIGGLKGKYKQGDDAAKEGTYKLVQEFADDFIAINDTISCYELLDCDFSTEKGKEKFKENNMLEEKCLQYVGDAVKLLEENVLS